MKLYFFKNNTDEFLCETEDFPNSPYEIVLRNPSVFRDQIRCICHCSSKEGAEGWLKFLRERTHARLEKDLIDTDGLDTVSIIEVDM